MFYTYITYDLLCDAFANSNEFSGVSGHPSITNKKLSYR